MPFSPQTRLAQKHDAVALLRGFGNFELLWVLLVTFLFTVAFRIGGWVFGSEVGWGASILLGIVTPLVLMMVMGVVVSVWETPRSQAKVETEPTRHDATRSSHSTSRSAPREEADPCVRVLQDAEGKRRVRIFRRHTGTYYFEDEYFGEHPMERCWIPIRGGAVGFYDSEQTALREAKANIDWLR